MQTVNEQIANLWMQNLTMAKIAEAIGITRSLVKTRIRRMQELGLVPPARETWTERNIAILREHATIGCSDEAIARELGCTTIAVIRKRHRMKIRRG
jgi:hypothetical protein